MKVSYNWLREYLATDKSPTEISDILTAIGLEVEGTETHESIPGGLRGVVIGKVLTAVTHPNADRLRVTTVDLGTDEPVQIVCGAPNVAAGQTVPVATVGTTLYDDQGGSFVIKKSKIRGERSEGMICAEDELGLGQSHDGIMVLPDHLAAGSPAADYFEVESDTVFEVGLTPNRSDATSHIGVARDVAAALQINHGEAGELTLPDTDHLPAATGTVEMQVTVADSEACPRYAGIVLEGLTVAPSPEWMQRRLTAIGVRPINNLVDITNFVLHEMGQPLHAFDLEQVSGNHIKVQHVPEGTAFTTLDAQERELHADDLLICDGDGKPMCIAGVFGGAVSGVTESTTSIFLESAYFHPIQTRRTANRHGLRTDAARTFEKGVDPNGVVRALHRAALLMVEYAGGTIASPTYDVYPSPILAQKINVSYAHVNRLIGTDMDAEDIKRILRALQMTIVTETEHGLTVEVPTDKADVTREADVIEEILRIYGFDRVPLPDSLRVSLNYGEGTRRYRLRDQVSNLLAANGFNEMMAVSLTASSYFDGSFGVPSGELVGVNNTSNQHLDVLRPLMLPGGLEAIRHNQNRQQQDLRLFEQGYTYRHTGEEQYTETAMLTLYLTGRTRAESWHDTGASEADFYQLKGYVELVLQQLGISGYQQTVVTESDVYIFGLRYHRGPQVLAEMGKVKSDLTGAFDIKQPVFYARLYWSRLEKSALKSSVSYAPISKYPSVRRDLALVVDQSVAFGEIEATARKQAKKLLQSVNLFDVYEDDEKVGEGKKSYAVSFVFSNPEKTLKDKEIDKLMQKVRSALERQVGAVVRG